MKHLFFRFGKRSLDERPEVAHLIVGKTGTEGDYPLFALAGGLLILLGNRWLLLFGAFINAMVLLFFFKLYQDQPAVMFSPGELVSKSAQILLEIALIYILVLVWKR